MKVITPAMISEDSSRADGLTMRTAFCEAVTGKKTTMGTASFPPGARSPVKDTVSHTGDEYSYVLSGSLRCVCNNEEFTVSAGDFAYIPANTEHYSFNPNEETAEVLWVLVVS
jgi:quercetin dioxygenase-like cupin family protein